MGAACDHNHIDSRPGHAEVEQALVAVEARCAAEGERMTAPRRRVLELLLAAGEPVKAYDLIARYGVDGQAAKPPTVYRALEFLERRGVVHRIASISAYVACTGVAGDAPAHAAAFLICDRRGGRGGRRGLRRGGVLGRLCDRTHHDRGAWPLPRLPRGGLSGWTPWPSRRPGV